MELMLEKWSGKVCEVSLGTTNKIGGQGTLPFLFKENKIPYPPIIAFEIYDTKPQDWPEELNQAYGNVLDDPLSWADKCVNEYRAQALCIRLQGAHPESADKTAAEEAKLITALLKKVSVPIIIVGCADDNKDNLVLPACSEAAKGTRCLIGNAVQDNYKTLAAALLADGHNIIAESPIDVNIAKQLNILISDMGLPLERIVINPTIGALGYGLEYAYSIMERSRLSALSGDKTIASPFICFVGYESWRSKEAKSAKGIIWEAVTAAALLQAGADILVMRHPLAIKKIGDYIKNLMTPAT